MPEAVRQRTTIVVPEAEVHEYTNAAEMYALASLPTILGCPVSGIAPTRDFIIDWAHAHDIKYLTMLDDDIVLQRRREDMRITNVRAPDEYIDAVNWVEAQLHGGFAHCGWGTRFLAYADPKAAIVVGRMMYCLAYDVAKIKEVGARFTANGSLETMEDFHMTLQLLQAGLPNIISLEWRASPGPSNAPGGCSTWRTTEIQSASARRLAELYPRLVTVRQKKQWDRMTEGMLDVRIAWRKACKL